MTPESGLTKEEFNAAKQIFDSIVDEIKRNEGRLNSDNVSSYETYIQLKNGEVKHKIDVSLYCIFQIVTYFKNYNSIDYSINDFASKLLSLLLKGSFLYSENELKHIIKEITKFINTSRHNYYIYYFPYISFLNKIEKYKEQNTLSDDIKESLLLLSRPNQNKDDLRINTRIKELIKGNETTIFSIEDYIITKDDVGNSLFQYFSDLTEIKQKIIIKFSEGLDLSTPTKKWLKEVNQILIETNLKSDLPVLINLFDETIKLVEILHKKTDSLWNLHNDIDLHYGDSKSNRWFFDKNEQLLRGFAWITSIINDKEFSNKIYETAIVSYKKKSEIGALLPRLGSACLFGLAQLPFQEGSAYLTNLKQKIKNTNANKAIEKYLQELATKSGKTKDEIEDESVSDFGLNENSELKTTFDKYVATLKINEVRKVELQWFNENKSQKSVPIEVKTNFPAEFKAFQLKIKQINESISIQSNRMESFFLKTRSWQFKNWENTFLKNGLFASISRNLIWYFENENQKGVAIYRDFKWIDNEEKVIDWLDENTKVQLWHPLGFEPSFILKWRQLLEKWQVLQPFKQAFREVYILTDAELNTQTYSNRFAAHILKNYQFGALLKIRNWGGYNQFHDGGVPEINLKNWKIKVQYWVEFINSAQWGDYISTDQVRFLNQNGYMDLTDVPALVFSETMRDIDLFVGVCSIGNDPNWRNGGNNIFGNEYWQSYSFGDLGELAKTRKETLEKIIPNLKIAKISEIKDKFLIVKGKLRTYKIHIGSGNIMMEPNDQYLCIVPDRSHKTSSAANLFIPFEGDNVLSIILSKAFMLANDDKITDSSIIHQIIG